MVSRPHSTPRVERRRARLLPRGVLRLDRAAADAINGGTGSAAMDGAFAALSRAADRGRLWFAAAAVLALLGRRRAALRGVLSLTVASILANLVGKRVFGGDRPLTSSIPVGRRLRRPPSSLSFPSGHTASAAAFAVGVALESPRAGALLAPAAAAVAYSRLHTGVHWLSDVVGGAALGAGVALVGGALGSGSLLPSRAIGRPGLRIDLPESDDGRGVLLLVNGSAGRHVSRRDPLRIISRRLPGATVRFLGRDSPEQVVRRALAGSRPPRILGVCGGDGTVSATAAVARSTGLPLLVLPGGTFNHFARAAGASSLDRAIDALQAGQGLRVDVADLRIDGGEPTTVLNAVGVGIYPDFVDVRQRFEDGWTKWGASVIAAARIGRSAAPVPVTVGHHTRMAWSVFVAVDRNSPRLVSTLQRRGLDDGVLDVRILDGATARLRAVASLTFGKRISAVLRAVHLAPSSARVDAFTAPSVRVRVGMRRGAPPPVTHDGELMRVRPRGSDGYEVEVRIVPQGLDVYSPGVGA
jgi:diacylglycerol kinase family enzyme/membrane-associated phospholipid phosphatase